MRRRHQRSRAPAGRRPAAPRAGPSAAALVLLVLLALFLGYAGQTTPLPDGVRLGATFAIVFTIVLLARAPDPPPLMRRAMGIWHLSFGI